MKTIDLNGSWQFRFENKTFLEDTDDLHFSANDVVTVPGTFDTLPDYYSKRGTALYRKEFRLEEACSNAFLRIDGMGLRARFHLDGRDLGLVKLPYSTFELETGALPAGKHVVTAAVDNNFDPEKMKLFLPGYDFYAFGGFYHGVSLKLMNGETALDRLLIRTLDYMTGKVGIKFEFKGKRPEKFTLTLSFDDGKNTTYSVAGEELVVNVPDFKLWSPDSPSLHEVTAETDFGTVTERFGIREIKAEKKEILLNGKSIYLKGFNRHESHGCYGAATPEQVMVEDLQNLRTLHCNFVRGCHYPQSQRFLDLCDEFGMLVWEESLGWGNQPESLGNPEFIDLQLQQTKLMVRNSYNHPSVIIFAFLNEFASQTPEGYALCEKLVKTIKSEDSGRLVTFACNHTDNDICNQLTDIISYNTYPGWISSKIEEPMAEILPDRDRCISYFRNRFDSDKPLIISEMGTCGVYGQHDRAGAQWTEEFQAEYLENVIQTVFASEEIRGLTIWQFNDAKSYLRQGGIRCKPFAQNLAGVFDSYRRSKLSAAVVEKYFGEK